MQMVMKILPLNYADLPVNAPVNHQETRIWVWDSVPWYCSLKWIYRTSFPCSASSLSWVQRLWNRNV